MGQGYFLARPAPAEMIVALLAAGTPLQPGPAELERAVDS